MRRHSARLGNARARPAAIGERHHDRDLVGPGRIGNHDAERVSAGKPPSAKTTSLHIQVRLMSTSPQISRSKFFSSTRLACPPVARSSQSDGMRLTQRERRVAAEHDMLDRQYLGDIAEHRRAQSRSNRHRAVADSRRPAWSASAEAAGHYVAALPKAEHDKPHWQTAAHGLMMAVEKRSILTVTEIAMRGRLPTGRLKEQRKKAPQLS